jgi:D-arabinitol dehydrogenase (NADP+)
MKALVYEKPEVYSIQQVPTPEPGPGEVRLQVRRAGVCGTDLHLHDGSFFGVYPLTPGHEVCGVIDKLGAGVNEGPHERELAVGQQVVVNGNFACGECWFCKRNLPLQCRNLTALGVTGPGGFAEYMIAPQRSIYNADGIPPDVAVFAEPLACTVHGMDMLQLKPGADVLILGAGPTSAMFSQLLVHGGAARVTAAATKPFKLQRLKSLGVDETVVIDGSDSTGAAARLRALRPEGFDVVIDATGAPPVQQQCVGLVKDRGTVLLYGVARPQDLITISPYEIYRREITLQGSFAQVLSFGQAVAFMQSGRVRTDGLITHRFDLDHWGAVLEALTSDPSLHKCIVEPTGP